MWFIRCRGSSQSYLKLYLTSSWPITEKKKIQNSYYEHNHYFRFSIPSRYARWWSKSKHECFWPFLKNVKNGNDRRREKQDTGHIFQSYWNDDRRRLFSATSSYIWLTADDGFYQKQPIFFDTSVWIGGGWWEETRLNDRFHIFFFFFGKWHAREGNFVRIWQLQIDAWQTTVKHHGARLLE